MFITALLLAATLATKADVPRVSAAELKTLMEKGEAVAVDVRGTVPWQYGHIAGAIWLPLGRVDQQFGKLPQDKLIVTYCTCKAEETSLEGAMKLANEHGFQRVAVLTGGYPAWKDAGYPVEEERTVHFSEGQPAAATPEPAPAPVARGGRLAPPEAVTCDRNQLTSHSGRITRYKRTKGKTVLVMDTSADTVETLTVTHPGTDDPSRFYLLEGQPFTKNDWAKVEKRKGELRPNLSAIAWVCTNGPTVIDWRPGVTFNGAE